MAKHPWKPGVRVHVPNRRQVPAAVQRQLQEREEDLQRQREIDLAWEEHHATS